MNARKEEKIIITCSPKELRDLADKMESRWKELCLGDSTFVDLVHIDQERIVCFHLDQVYFEKTKQ